MTPRPAAHGPPPAARRGNEGDEPDKCREGARERERGGQGSESREEGRAVGGREGGRENCEGGREGGLSESPSCPRRRAPLEFPGRQNLGAVSSEVDSM